MSRLAFLGSFLAILMHMVPCHGQVFSDWHWRFDQPTYVVGPTESIILNATIFVDADSPGPLIGPMSVSFNGTMFSLYDLSPEWGLAFAEASIAPGDSLHFTFGILTPKAAIPEGSYQNSPDQPLIESLPLATRRIPDSPLIIQVVPEPSIFALIGCSGLAFVAVYYRRKIPCRLRNGARRIANS